RRHTRWPRDWSSDVCSSDLMPGDQDYEAARHVYNADIDRRPDAIVQCAGVADVIHCVNYAREQKVTLAVRGGSHSVPGFGTSDRSEEHTSELQSRGHLVCRL